jgi:ferric-chelate reductase
MLRLSPGMSRLGEIATLSLILGSSAAATIVLTFFPCYATLCSEEYFPFETRVHLITYYGFLILTTFFFVLRQYNQTARSLSGFHLFYQLPLLGKRITLGGFLFFVWTLAVVGAPTVFWLPVQDRFWGLRADPLNWSSAKLLLTITGVTGHYADILLGLLIIPVSRNSLVGHAFSLHQSSLLFAHKMISYLFAIGATAHGVSYIVSVDREAQGLEADANQKKVYATDGSSEGDKAKEEAFATGNPAMTLTESKQRSSWFTMTTYTGIGALLPIFLIVLTSIPWIRRRHYNLFYYNHVLLGTSIFATSCIHASTDLYLLIPGLLLWFIDLIRRFFFGETNGLSRTVLATLEHADNGWIRISLPASKSTELSTEKRVSSTQPLCYYYLNFPSVSKLQNHAFTAAIPSSSASSPVFLLQRTKGKKPKTLDKE